MWLNFLLPLWIKRIIFFVSYRQHICRKLYKKKKKKKKKKEELVETWKQQEKQRAQLLRKKFGTKDVWSGVIIKILIWISIFVAWPMRGRQELVKFQRLLVLVYTWENSGITSRNLTKTTNTRMNNSKLLIK